MTTLIIAEIGVNHDGSIEKAKKLIVAAKKAGADIAKFQFYDTSQMIRIDAKLADYQKSVVKNYYKSQSEMLNSYQFDLKHFKILKNFCNRVGIAFMVSVFDLKTFDITVKFLKAKKVKIGSGELTNYLLLSKVGKYKIKCILSTGMGNIKHINMALSAIALGYYGMENRYPIRDFIKTKIFTQWLQTYARKNVTLMHCVSEYPTSDTSINLKSIQTLSDTFNLKIGFSDHSLSNFAPSLAVAMGAVVIEKHITLDKSYLGPDHKASLDPAQFRQMVENIQLTEKILGRPGKFISQIERKNSKVVKKGMYFARDIKKGDILSLNDIVALRPQNQLSIEKAWMVVGKKAKRNFERYSSVPKGYVN